MAAPKPDVHDIFNIAVECPSDADRAQYLDEACRDTPQIRGRVEALIRPHHAAGSFLEGDAPTVATPPAELAGDNEQPGTTIGRYELIREIGQGGMGVVFLAEQSQPVKRNVALKIIKPGMDTREVVARFETERQALALMEHPNISHVLDGGSTQSGRPYFVMELVEGAPITDFCDEHRSTTRERLELFVQVCQAVQHAHQKGIIHRDIKPSNILVTFTDETAVPKVIDFGIAKAVHQPLTDGSLLTQATHLIGTPMYMSPEQADLGGQDIDTRTDVYSLGVVLYQLLAGTGPFDKERLDRSGLEEVKRIIQEEEPPRPSTRLSTANTAVETIAEQHSCDPQTLARELAGELDWIVMKCLEKDRSRRYESPSALAADVQRYLSGNLVEACPPSAVYRLRKFARRNRGLLTTTATVVLALFVGTGVSLWQAIDAHRARDQAEENFRRARGAVDTYLTKISEDQLLNEPSMQPLRKELLELALDYYQGFIQQRPDDPERQADLADAYQRVGEIIRETGSKQDAQQAIEKALKLREQLVALHPANPTYQQALASSKRQLAARLTEIGQTDQSQNLYHEATAILEKLVERHPNVPEYQSDLGKAYILLGCLLHSLGRSDEGATLDAKAISTLEKLAEQNPTVAEYQSDLASYFHDSAAHTCQLGRFNEAMPLFDKAISMQEAVVQRAPDVLDYQDSLALYHTKASTAHQLLGQTEEALADCQNAIPLQEKLAEQNPKVTLYRSRLATSYAHQACLDSELGRFDEAKTFCEKAIAFQEELVEENPEVLQHRFDLAIAYDRLGNRVLVKSGQLAEASDFSRKAISILESLSKQNPDALEYQYVLACICSNLAAIPMKTGQTEEALKLTNKATSIMQVLVEKNPKSTKFQRLLPKLYMDAGCGLWKLGRKDEAVTSYEKALHCTEIMTDSFYDELVGQFRGLGARELALAAATKGVQAAPNRVGSYNRRALLYRDFGQYEKAIADHSKAIELKPRRSYEYKRRGQVYFMLGRYEEALADLQKALELNPSDPSCVYWINSASVAKCPDEAFREGVFELADRAIEVTDDLPYAYGARGILFAGSGQTAAALDDFAKSIELNPKESMWQYWHALIQLSEGNLDAYRKGCADMLSQLADSTDNEVAFRTVWVCSLGPDAVHDFSTPIRMVKNLMEGCTKCSLHLNAFGAILHRAGRSEEAIEHLTEANDLIEHGQQWATEHRASIGYFLAMAHHQLGQDVEAAQWLEEANQQTDKAIANETAAEYNSYHGRITLQILRREAEALLKKAEHNDTEPTVDSERTRSSEDN